MRVSTWLAVLGLFLGSTLCAWAASTTTTPVPYKSANPQTHQINLRLRNQWTLVQKGIKSGKFTKEQGASFRADLKSVREQEVGFFKQNKSHELTADQQSQLDASLDKNSSTLGETPTNN
jgi:hypothetical protein